MYLKKVNTLKMNNHLKTCIIWTDGLKHVTIVKKKFILLNNDFNAVFDLDIFVP